MNMRRRSLFGWLSAIFAGPAVAKIVVVEPDRIVETVKIPKTSEELNAEGFGDEELLQELLRLLPGSVRVKSPCFIALGRPWACLTNNFRNESAPFKPVSAQAVADILTELKYGNPRCPMLHLFEAGRGYSLTHDLEQRPYLYVRFAWVTYNLPSDGML